MEIPGHFSTEIDSWLHDERPDLIAALHELRGKDLAC
jgi:hypothetical protein